VILEAYRKHVLAKTGQLGLAKSNSSSKFNLRVKARKEKALGFIKLNLCVEQAVRFLILTQFYGVEYNPFVKLLLLYSGIYLQGKMQPILFTFQLDGITLLQREGKGQELDITWSGCSTIRKKRAEPEKVEKDTFPQSFLMYTITPTSRVPLH
jgi:hypothetical protein